jgi:hypothetical protein
MLWLSTSSSIESRWPIQDEPYRFDLPAEQVVLIVIARAGLQGRRGIQRSGIVQRRQAPVVVVTVLYLGRQVAPRSIRALL